MLCLEGASNDRLASCLFARHCSAQGVGLDSYAKQWRIFADCLNDIGV